MTVNLSQIFRQLKSLGAKDDARVQRAVTELGDLVEVGNISNSTGVAIGRNIRLVVNHFNLAPETVAALLALRNEAGAALGLDPNKYRLDTLLAEKTHGFVGRQHIFKEIENFLTTVSNGYLVISADPGMGKTSLLAEYVLRTGCIAHFNVRANGIVETAKFLDSICSQVIVDYGLSYTSLPVNATHDGAFLEQILGKASQKLGVGEKLVIAVDALDEVDLASQTTCTNILCLPDALPQGVYILMTRRPMEVPFRPAYHEINLMNYPAENRADVTLYLSACAQCPAILAWLRDQRITQNTFVESLANQSECNFMYLRHVLPEIENGQYHQLTIRELPKGLMGYYRDHWLHMGMEAKPRPRQKIMVVYILCEALQPISCARITQILRYNRIAIDEIEVQAILDEWQEFLHEPPSDDGKRFSIYHGSFRDFLHRQDIVQAAGLTIKDVNRLISEELRAGWYGGSMG